MNTAMFNIEEWFEYFEREEETTTSKMELRKALSSIVVLLKKIVPDNNFVYKELAWIKEDIEAEKKPLSEIRKQLSNAIFSHLYFGI